MRVYYLLCILFNIYVVINVGTLEGMIYWYSSLKYNVHGEWVMEVYKQVNVKSRVLG